MLLRDGFLNIVVIRSGPPAKGEPFLWPAWGLDDPIEGDVFDGNHFSHVRVPPLSGDGQEGADMLIGLHTHQAARIVLLLWLIPQNGNDSKRVQKQEWVSTPYSIAKQARMLLRGSGGDENGHLTRDGCISRWVHHLRPSFGYFLGTLSPRLCTFLGEQIKGRVARLLHACAPSTHRHRVDTRQNGDRVRDEEAPGVRGAPP